MNLAPKYIIKKYFILDTLDRLSITALPQSCPRCRVSTNLSSGTYATTKIR